MPIKHETIKLLEKSTHTHIVFIDSASSSSPEPLDVTHFVTAGVLPQVIHHGDVHRYGHILRFDGDEVSKGHLSNKPSIINAK